MAVKNRSKSVNTVEAKNRLNELIAQVNKTKEPLVVEKRGEPVAVVLDYESYRKETQVGRRTSDKAFLKELRNFHQIMKRKYPEGTGDTVEILRQVRKERVR